MLARTRTVPGAVRLIAVVASLALILGAAGCGAIDSLTGTRAETSSSDPSMGAPYLYGDSAKDGGGAVAGAPYADEGVAAQNAVGDVATNVTDADRLVIRNKALRIEVKKVAEALDQVKAAAKAHDGIITNMQVASDNGSPIFRYADSGVPSDGAPLLGYVTVRVPADAFAAFVDEVSKIGTVRFQAESSDDVTQQHVDLKARLENLRAQEKRLREFFDAAKNVTEMLAIESELARVRGDIESLDAQVKYLERQAAMATVTIDLSEPQAIVRPDGEDWGFGDAITTGFRGAAGAIQLLIVLTITLSPYALIVAALFFVVRAIIRARRKRVAGSALSATTEEPVVTE